MFKSYLIKSSVSNVMEDDIYLVCKYYNNSNSELYSKLFNIDIITQFLVNVKAFFHLFSINFLALGRSLHIFH